MTYKELYEKAAWQLESGRIDIAEFEKRIEPLNTEVWQWIPCSERLPECGQYVLCSQDNGDVGEAQWLGDEWLIPWDNDLLKQDEVFAWRELPEPWKGEEK